MSAEYRELNKSRALVIDQRYEVLGQVFGTDDEAEAYQLAIASVPASYAFAGGSGSGSGAVTLPLATIQLEPEWVDEEAEDGLWNVTATYAEDTASQPAPVENDSTISFDTGGGSTHITQGKANVLRLPSPGVTPDFGGAIGFDGENFQGVDIVTPMYKFSETHYKSANFVDQSYRLALMDLTGKVNSGAFRGFAAGEVLFLGASGARRGRRTGDLWELTYNFAASKNATNLTVGGISVSAKGGWEYLWVYYSAYVDTTAKQRAKQPKGVYVERVYDSASFGGLGL